jgi:hypothetical protein
MWRVLQQHLVAALCNMMRDSRQHYAHSLYHEEMMLRNFLFVNWSNGSEGLFKEPVGSKKQVRGKPTQWDC